MARTIRRIPENIESKVKYNRVVNTESLRNLYEDFSRGKLQTYIDTDAGFQEDSPEGKRFWKRFYNQRNRRLNKKILDQELKDSEFYFEELEDLKIRVYNLVDSTGNLELVSQSLLERACEFIEDLYLQTQASGLLWLDPIISLDSGIVFEFYNREKYLSITIDYSDITYFRSWGADLHNQSDYGDFHTQSPIYNWLVKPTEIF